MASRPDLRYERALWREGIEAVAGVDEAGVGPMAGPVVAAAVLFAPETLIIPGVDDSKKLTPERRDELCPLIMERALTVGIARAGVEEIDRLNIYQATALAIRRALAALARRPGHALIDGRKVPGLQLAHTPIVGGDRKSFSIAAASIVAKVARDRMMREYDRHYPGYGFARHKGYCTPEHLRLIERLGPSPIHRRSFAPVAAAAQLGLIRGRAAEAAPNPPPNPKRS